MFATMKSTINNNKDSINICVNISNNVAFSKKRYKFAINSIKVRYKLPKNQNYKEEKR